MSKHVPESEMRSSAAPVDRGKADKLTEPLATDGTDRDHSRSPFRSTILSELSTIAQMLYLMTTEEKATNLERLITLTKVSTEDSSNA